MQGLLTAPWPTKRFDGGLCARQQGRIGALTCTSISESCPQCAPKDLPQSWQQKSSKRPHAVMHDGGTGHRFLHVIPSCGQEMADAMPDSLLLPGRKYFVACAIASIEVAVFFKFRVPFVGVLVMGALLFGVYIWAPRLWKLPNFQFVH